MSSNFLKYWLLATRPWSFVMTGFSISVGSALAAIQGPFSPGLFCLTLMAAVFLHAAANLSNDYYDFKKGLDTRTSGTALYRPHLLVNGKLQPESVRVCAMGLFVAGIALGIWLIAARGWLVLGLGVLGIGAGLAYTAPPFNYKNIALGEVFVFLIWGPLMVEGSYFVQAGGFSLQAMWVSIPLGVLVALALLANNLRDIASDQARGIRTLAILLGEQRGFYLYGALLIIAYASIVLLVVFGVLAGWSLAVFFSLPLAGSIFRDMLQKIPDDADARTAQMDTAFGILLLMSLVLEALL
ncbi:MAG: 1,4-dihydroxy-2-naphthoate octaprenyltransferase [Desulfohalobiaceae bacterium]